MSEVTGLTWLAEASACSPVVAGGLEGENARGLSHPPPFSPLPPWLLSAASWLQQQLSVAGAMMFSTGKGILLKFQVSRFYRAEE